MVGVTGFEPATPTSRSPTLVVNQGAINILADAARTGGQAIVPYEQNTQQTPGLGGSTLPQSAQS